MKLEIAHNEVLRETRMTFIITHADLVEVDLTLPDIILLSIPNRSIADVLCDAMLIARRLEETRARARPAPNVPKEAP